MLLGMCGGRVSGTKDVLVLRLTETIKQLTLNLQFSQRVSPLFHDVVLLRACDFPRCRAQVIREEYTDTEFLNGCRLSLQSSTGNVVIRRRTPLAAPPKPSSAPHEALKRPRSEPHNGTAIIKRLLTNVELPSSVHSSVSASLASVLSPKRSSRQTRLDSSLSRLSEHITALKSTYAKSFRDMLLHCTAEFKKELPPLLKMVEEHGSHVRVRCNLCHLRLHQQVDLTSTMQAHRQEYERLYASYIRMKDQLRSMPTTLS